MNIFLKVHFDEKLMQFPGLNAWLLLSDIYIITICTNSSMLNNSLITVMVQLLKSAVILVEVTV